MILGKMVWLDLRVCPGIKLYSRCRVQCAGWAQTLRLGGGRDIITGANRGGCAVDAGECEKRETDASTKERKL